MNLGDLKRRAYSQLRDTSKAFVADSEMEDWLNDGYIDLSARLQLLQKEKSTTTAAATIPLPPTVSDPEPVQVLSLRFGDDDVEWVDDDTFNAWKDSDATPPHTLGRVWNSAIELYPVPSIGTAYVLRYSYLPAVMEDVGDEPALPVHLHVKLVYYALAQAKLKYGELDEADRFLVMYEQNLPPPIRGLITLRPAPLSLIPVGGVFDLDPEARHI